jgi:hypothetical protein
MLTLHILLHSESCALATTYSHSLKKKFLYSALAGGQKPLLFKLFDSGKLQ